MSAASRLFAVYELIYAICKHAQIPEDDDEYWFVKPALPSLARVARFVGSVALDVLWERQESLAPLFKVLPCLLRRRELRTAWEASDEDPDDFPDETYEILSMKAGRDGTRTIPPDQWERLQMYARRIKVLKDGGPIVRADRHHVSLNWHVMAAALRCCDGGVLLPNVHSLMLGEQMKAFLDDMALRFCPTSAADGSQITYASIVRTAPSHAVVGNLCRLDALQSFATIPDRNLEPLAGLRAHAGPGLVELQFSKVGVESDLERCAAASAPSFQGLKTLRISDPFMLSCPTMILQNMSTEPLKLRELSITGWRFVESKPAKALKLYRAIRDACDAATLTHLTVLTHIRQRNHEEPRMVAREFFADLFAFPNITHVEITFACENADVDGALDAATKAWPRLEVLRFGNRLDRTYDPCLAAYEPTYEGASLASLACLAQRCPRLSSLALELDTSTIPPPIAPVVTLERKITMEIGFSYSRYDTHAVGLFLASVFPWPTLVIEDVHGDARVEAINLAIESTKPAPTKSLTTKQAHRRAKRVPVSPEVRDKLTARHQAATAKLSESASATAPESAPRTLASSGEMLEPIPNTPVATAVEPVVAAEPPKTRASKRKRGADSLVVQEDARPAKTRKIPTKTRKALAKTPKAIEADKPPARTRAATGRLKNTREVKRTTEPTRRSERLRAKASKAQNGQGDRD